MRSIQSFQHLMPQTVTIANISSRDGYGKPTYGVGTKYPARIVGKNRLVRDRHGNEIMSTHSVYLGTNASISPTARVTLPTGYDPSQPPIVSIGQYPDQQGVFATVVFLSAGASVT